MLLITSDLSTEHHHKGHDHVHDSAVSSVSIVSEGTLDLDYVSLPLPYITVLLDHLITFPFVLF